MFWKLAQRRARLAVAAGLVLVVPVLLAATASAHNPVITADVDCNGLVTYTATAWSNGNPAARTNDNIRIWISSDGGPFEVVPHEAQHRFNAANSFTFTDQHQLSAPLPDEIVVRAQAQVNWADGVGPGPARETNPIDVPPPCPTTTTTASTTTTAPATTTTTAPSTTTTTAPDSTTTTTGGATTTTTGGATTTTVGGASVTTTTDVGTGSQGSTTTAPDGSVDVEGSGPSTPTTAESEVQAIDELPFTGSG